MSRPRPSANTVTTVSTSPFLISDSRPFGSARSSGTVRSPESDRRRDTQQAPQSAAILPGRGHAWQYASVTRQQRLLSESARGGSGGRGGSGRRRRGRIAGGTAASGRRAAGRGGSPSGTG